MIISVFVLFGVLGAFALVVAGMALRAAIVNLRFSHVCPDYHSFMHAWVVGPNGAGMDSVAVTMRDNQDYNLIYRTFTDSAGRFELFSDFHSFTLFDGPGTYHLHVSAGGASETILYKFERHRVCHFRKVAGPDTIRFVPSRKGTLVTLSDVERVTVTDICSDLPFEHCTMHPTAPSSLREPLQGWGDVSYGLLSLGGASMIIAVARTPAQGIGPGNAAYYILDRNRDGSLNDDTPHPWRSASTGEPSPCIARPCSAVDSLVSGGRLLHFELAVRQASRATQLDYRCVDAVTGTFILGDTQRRALIWDRLGAGFADLRTVLLAFDGDADGSFSCTEGSPEVFENAARRIRVDTMTFVVDTIYDYPPRLACSGFSPSPPGSFDARVGTMLPDIRAHHRAPLSLWQQCGDHDFVVLYCFQGSSRSHMQAPHVNALVTVMSERLGSTRLIGLNRNATGPVYTDQPVIEENRGWRGELVAKLHNHRDQEVICIDSLATVVCRAEPGRSAVEKLFSRVDNGSVGAALARYDQLMGDAALLAEASYDSP
ncbi:MAG: hypothetical protein GF331_25460 [Chitinivibrionales bacterium]|nr:hypothetical protein [Chitinivibrionales bacterium]